VLLALAASVLAVKSATAPAKKFTVVTFGDSTTNLRKGVEVYTTQLAQRMPEAQFLNRGVGGNTTELARKRFERDVLAAKPDLLIVQFGMNDSVIDVWKVPSATKPRVSLADYERNLRFFVTAVQHQGGAVILMTSNQRRWSKIFRERYALPPYDSKDEHGLLLLMPEYAAAVRRLGRDCHVPVVDVYALYDRWEKTTGRSCSELMLDGQHPNTAGQRLVADALEPEVRRILTTSVSR
jgi:lysophospholipase L1-like esterase